LTHRNIQIEGNSGGRAFSCPAYDMILPDIITSAHAAITENAGAMIHEKDGRGGIEFPATRAWPRCRWLM
jgi:hypothetical protein